MTAIVMTTVAPPSTTPAAVSAPAPASAVRVIAVPARKASGPVILTVSGLPAAIALRAFSAPLAVRSSSTVRLSGAVAVAVVVTVMSSSMVV